MGEKEVFVEELKALIGNQARTFALKTNCRRLMLLGKRRQTARRVCPWTQHPEGAGTGERAGSASQRSREGVSISSRLQTISEVEVARGSTLALRSRGISSIKTAVSKLGDNVDFYS